MTSKPGNVAAWQVEPKGSIIIKETEVYEPGPGEIRIKVFAAPIQPAEAKQALSQVMPRFKYPGILGSQCAGIVDKIGEGITKVEIGDRVSAGLNNYANGGDPSRASLQRFVIAEEYETIRIGDDLPFIEAVSINTQTPGGALFSHTTLGLDRPSSEPPLKPVPKGKKILIWGGSSAMGALSICYAKLAGYEVITTSSPKNFELVKARGADHVFDRNDPNVAERIQPLLPIDFWFDTISLADSVRKIIQLATVQHKQTNQDVKLLTLLPMNPQFTPGLPKIPSFLKTQMHLFKNKAPENKDHVEWLMGTPNKPGFLERGLRGGWIKGVPAKSIGGLDKVEEGIRMVHEGRNSGFKVVIEPWKE